MTETVLVTVASGLDAGKVFCIRQLPAERAEAWAIRAFLAAANAGVAVPDDLTSAGLPGLAQLDLNALGKLSWADMEPLLAEMKRCWFIVPDAGKPRDYHAPAGNDILDVGTVIALRLEWIKLHLPMLAKLQPVQVVHGVVQPPKVRGRAMLAPAGNA